jgi:hypothetical protein
LSFCSIGQRWPVTQTSKDNGVSLFGRDLAVHLTSPLRVNTRLCLVKDFNHNVVTPASGQRQLSVPRIRASRSGPENRSSKWQFAMYLGEPDRRS